MTEIKGNVGGVPYTITTEVVKGLNGINVEAEVRQALNAELGRTAEIYTKPNCPYCVRAKMLCQQEGIEITEINAVENKETLVERVTRDSGRPPQTVPQIYLDGKYVGGYTELAALIAAEKNAQ